MSMFLLRTRPDIAHSVNILATRCAGATTRDLDSMLDLVRYLKRTQHLELIYQTGSHKQGEAIRRLYGWADAAYARLSSQWALTLWHLLRLRHS